MKPIYYKNIKISYSDSGMGKVVVFLHGLLENKNMFDAFLPDILKTHRAITIDLLGHGQTSCIGYSHAMEDQANMIMSLLTQLNITKAAFIGHSMGGYVALAIADLYPGIMTGLLLLNSSAFEDSKERILNRNRGIKVAQTDYETLVKLSVANLFAETSRKNHSQEIELTKTEALKTPVQGYIAAQEGMKLRKNRVSVLQSSKIPTHMILGKKDPVLNYEETKIQVENTSVKLSSLEGGHMSTIEAKSELKILLLNFIESI